MAQERYDIPTKEINDYDDEYDNDGLDDYSDDYDDDERYQYGSSAQQERDGRRGNSFSYSGSGHSNEINEDNRKDHHNQLERKRRASIKGSYTELREAIPSLRDNKASRSVILQKAVDYLEELNRRNIDHVACVDHFSTENSALEAKCREIENQVQLLLRQQRQSNVSAGPSNSNSHHYSLTLAPRGSLRGRDEEDSNDLTGSTNSTPSVSTSRSITSSSTTSTSRVDVQGGPLYGDNEVSNHSNTRLIVLQQSNHNNNNNNDHNHHHHQQLQPTITTTTETGSNSSSADYYDEMEDIVAAKKSRTD